MITFIHLMTARLSLPPQTSLLTWLWVICFLCYAGSGVCGAESEGAGTVAVTNATPKPPRVMVVATNRMQTLIGFFGRAQLQHPWPNGNRVSIHFRKPAPPAGLETFVDLKVVNIYAENLTEILKRIGTETIEMAVYPRTNFIGTIWERDQGERQIIHEWGYAVITDTRIPREWFHYSPVFGNSRVEKGDEMLSAFPLSFKTAKRERERMQTMAYALRHFIFLRYRIGGQQF